MIEFTHTTTRLGKLYQGDPLPVVVEGRALFPARSTTTTLTPGVQNRWVGFDSMADGPFVEWILARVRTKFYLRRLGRTTRPGEGQPCGDPRPSQEGRLT